MRHTIAKVAISANAQKLSGIDLQNSLSSLFWRELRDAMDVLFDRYTTEGETLSIHRIDIDLGYLDAHNWESAFIDKMLAALEQAIVDAKHAAGKAKHPKGGGQSGSGTTGDSSPASFTPGMSVPEISDTWLGYLKTGILPMIPLRHDSPSGDPFSDSEDAPNERLLPSQRRLFELWLYFIRTGTLPPDAVLPETEKQWLQAVLATIASDAYAVRQFLEVLKRSPANALRLAQQFDEAFLNRLAAVLNLAPIAKLSEFRILLATFWTEAKPAKKQDPEQIEAWKQIAAFYAKPVFWAVYFQVIAVEAYTNLQAERAALLPFETWWMALQRKQTALADKLRLQMLQLLKHRKNSSVFQNNKALQAGIAGTIGAGIDAKADTPANTTEVFHTDPDRPITGNQPDPRPLEQRVEAIVQAPDFDRKSPIVPDGADAIYLQHAGIVLVHAFLPAFFREAGLLDAKNQFLDHDAQQRGIHLVQFLATGEENLPEYRLLLPKLLCGLPFDIPIERDIVLTEAEKTEADALLKAIIGHWSVLGNTSIAGLREGFIDRTGKLTHTQNGPLLQVEQRTPDILLSRLPWGIGMIKLPWMREMLRVEWGT
ncbi:MAG: contractile injection system tape measure protein [Saprospiraceae bacterium]